MKCSSGAGVVLLVACLLPGGALAAESTSDDMQVVAGTGEAGFEDGSPGKLNKPIRLAPYGDGAVLVADIFNHAIRVVSLDGGVKTIAGGPERMGFQDGPAVTARFAAPHGVAIDAEGQIAVAEAENHTIRLLTPVSGNSGQGPQSFVVSTSGRDTRYRRHAGWPSAGSSLPVAARCGLDSRWRSPCRRYRKRENSTGELRSRGYGRWQRRDRPTGRYRFGGFLSLSDGHCDGGRWNPLDRRRWSSLGEGADSRWRGLDFADRRSHRHTARHRGGNRRNPLSRGNGHAPGLGDFS